MRSSAHTVHDLVHTEKWLDACSVSNDPCQHHGYLGADCSCVCPAGTSGDQCQHKNMDYTGECQHKNMDYTGECQHKNMDYTGECQHKDMDYTGECQHKDMDHTEALIAKYLPYNAEITTETTISSPGYPMSMPEGTMYTIRITAPAGKKVSLKFNDFDIAARCTHAHVVGLCCLDGLEMRLDGKPTSGTWYCGKEITAGREFVSEDNVLVFFYHTLNYKKFYLTTSNKGYEAQVTFV
ncbi:CUB domain [Trinorchestia longiramus]|nr:CUB domain [Trinorchestia longiramus]